ncbi:MAG TPA: ATP-binding protein, partial [Anaerolineae bacterium]|nr:ATP-binding protein [Anaerolineae bacterium]
CFVAFGILMSGAVAVLNRTEEALSTEREQLAVTLRSIGEGVITTDVEGRVVLVNRAAESLTGWAQREAVGTPLDAVFRIIHDMTREPRENPAARVLESGTLVELADHTLLVSRDGTERSLALTAAPILSDKEGLIGVVLVFRDITQRRLAADLARSNAELEQFAYVASHDLQEPLRMVSSYVQLLARRYKGQLDADADDFIEFAVDGAKRMQDLVSDLLAYSRVGTRGDPFERTDCEAVLALALGNLELAIQESGAQVTHDALPVVVADGPQLAQVLQNLIANSIKFRSEQPPRIHVSATRIGDEWVLCVRDNGIGIDPQYHERVFVLFQRLHTRGEYPGTGIGLAICRRIAERHSGRIWVESELGQGSAFHFAIPMRGDQEECVPQ